MVDIITTFENDWTGEPAVFLMVILADADTGPNRLRDITNQVERAITDRVEPMEKWGVYPYFNYRSQSEQAKLDPAALA